ncbi:hypothetical protein SDC9_202129 [bioreactor metagenome]|uniref:Uncharacterized protein n=1 Tax=bioreactor metagenome TaxID=1076179 RepID=A0A645IVK9_9ZZZZ
MGAEAAAQADGGVEPRLPAAGVVGIAGAHHAHRLHGADLGAFAAAGAGRRVHARQEIRRAYGIEHGEALGGEHGLTAAAAAVADEGHGIADVLPELDKVVRYCLVEEVQALALIHAARDSVLDEGLRDAVEGHADVQGRAAGAPEVPHLVAAIAGAETFR